MTPPSATLPCFSIALNSLSRLLLAIPRGRTGAIFHHVVSFRSETNRLAETGRAPAYALRPPWRRSNQTSKKRAES